MNSTQVIIFGLVTSVSWALARLLVHWAPQLGLQDVPNERSLHTRVTPRGGGLSFVIVFLLANIFYKIINPNLGVSWFFLLSAFIVAAVGVIDDRFNLAARFRLAAQFIAAVLFLYSLNFLEEAFNLSFYLSLNELISLVAVLFIVWFINLYNFMDGIDGLAGIEAMTLGLSLAYFFYDAGDVGHSTACLILVFSVLGFLVLNWSPAKIFMGDSGSGFLGFCFAALMLYGFSRSYFSIFVPLILSAAFVYDATHTLIVRLFRSQKIYQAHRDHTYQHLVQMGWSHSQVSCLWGLVNILWLSPLAFAAHKFHGYAFLIAIAAYLPLLVIAIRFRAGLPMGSIDSSRKAQKQV